MSFWMVRIIFDEYRFPGQSLLSCHLSPAYGVSSFSNKLPKIPLGNMGNSFDFSSKKTR
jgi:hypothetical protein